MTRFAGSQRIDERRRRRLATESEGVEPSSSRTRRPREDRLAAKNFRPADFIRDDCPVLGLIPAQIWKHWLGACAALVLGGALLAGAHYEPLWAKQIGPGATRMLSLSTGRTVELYSQLLLLAAAQAALLIRWARARSFKDFAGSYQVWGWTAALWTAFAGCISTGAHLAWGETLVFFWPRELVGKETLCWLVPTLFVANWLWIRLSQEMRGCRSSRWAFITAGALYTLAAAVYLRGTSPIPMLPELAKPFLLQGGLLAGHVSLLLSMTLHVRHVLYTTAEPPPRREAALRKSLLSRLFAGWRWPSFARKSANGAKSAATAAKSNTKRPRRKPASRKSPEQPDDANQSSPEDEAELTEAATTDAEEAAEETEEDAEQWEREQERVTNSPRAEHRPTQANKAPSHGGDSRHIRVDEAEDDGPEPHSGGGDSSSDLKGLSKRERRRLQQQRREEERLARRGSA